MDLLFVGDIRVGEDFPLEDHLKTVSSIAPGAQLIGNLEIPLCSDGWGSPAEKSVPFRGSESLVGSLKSGGFESLSLANNHSTSWGIGGLIRTRDVLADGGIFPMGAGLDQDEAFTPWRSEDGSVAVISASAAIDSDMLAGDRRAGISGMRLNPNFKIDPKNLVEMGVTDLHAQVSMSQAELEDICDRVSTLAKEVPVVIVYMHWGKLFNLDIAPWQLEVAEKLADAGAKLIVGCHSHVIGPIGSYHDTSIFFGLGNWAWSKDLLEESTNRHPGQMTRIRRWGRVQFGLHVSIESGTVTRTDLFPLEFDMERGIVTKVVDDEEWGAVGGVLRWLSYYSWKDRPAWSLTDPWPEHPGWFPIGYR